MTIKKIDLVERVVNQYLDTFHKKPQLLGTPNEVNANFLVIDQIDFILKYGREMDSFDLSWTMFLLEKKYIQGSENRLSKTLQEDDSNFVLLKELRKEFEQWQKSKVEHLKLGSFD